MNTSNGPQQRLAQVLGQPQSPDMSLGGAPVPEAPPGVGAIARWGTPLTWAVLVGVLLLVAVVAALAVARDNPQPMSAAVIESAPPDDGTPNSGGAPAAITATPAVSATPGPSPPAEVVVHVSGQVARPGVVRLAGGARVSDALTAVGGALPGVVLDDLNLARPLTDGEQVAVGVPPAPAPAPVPSGDSAAGSSVVPPAPGAPGGDTGKVNLNTATSEELQTLPRVGPATAQKIIEFREQNGPLASVEQLVDIPGIGEKTLENLRDLVTV